jgi:Na+-transporting methylmalonyl-CoA/oxaloacetate decarboxylase gamma subunit
MLKRLMFRYWPLLLLFTLIVAVLCMSRYAENRKAGNQEDAQISGPQAMQTRAPRKQTSPSIRQAGSILSHGQKG